MPAKGGCAANGRDAVETGRSDIRTPEGDRQAIAQMLYLYCRAMDRMDLPLGYSIWHEDGTADYGEGIFHGTGRGFVDFAAKAHAGMVTHSHQVTAIIIDLDGDRAASESYVTAALRIKDGDRLLETTTRGRYLDRWSHRGGRWAIDRRIYVHDLDDTREVQPTSIPPRSARDRSDPSYAVLEFRS